MGKKKKEKPLLRSSTYDSKNEFFSLQDEVIQHLQLLKESNGLLIGFNTVIRGIEKNALCIIIYISRKGTSAMYHALNLMCKDKDVLFLQLEDINSIVFNSKIPTSTTYGIKKSIIEQPQFSKLLKIINIAGNSRKSQKEKAVEKSYLKNEEFSAESQSLYKDIKSENSSEKCEVDLVIHPKHDIPKQNSSGMLNFQEVNFPNYKTMFPSNDILQN